MRIFATKQIECGGQVRPFKVNLFAMAQFCEAKGIKLSEIGTRLADPSLMDMMELAYYCHVAAGGEVDRAEFMTWFDESDLFMEFTELVTSAFEVAESDKGKPKKASR